jgi:hypothetical protein
MAKPVTSPQAVVDVAINVYGKPYQTAVTLFSLVRQSGTWIDKLYFIEERRQPAGTDLGPLKRALQQLGKPVVYYRPWFWFWVDNELRHRRWLKYRWFRWATRYQYAWEKTDKNYLLVTHNDMLFTGDLVGTYLKEVGNNAGIGQIGQCWNCPAFTAQLCEPTRYTEYQPTYQEVKELIAEYPPARPQLYETLDPRDPWPLPECRLNEYVALINLAVARPATMPEGSVLPFGTYGGLDTAILWFREMNQAGYMFRHLDFNTWATHAWANGINSGHRALFDKDIYAAEEAIAKQKLADEFGILF